MQNNVFLRLAQERYTTKHYNGQQIPREEFDPELRVTCSTFRIAAVVQKAGAIQNSADARQEYCS